MEVSGEQRVVRLPWELTELVGLRGVRGCLGLAHCPNGVADRKVFLG